MKGKKIILAISGSIAAYKAALLVRILAKSGVEVKVLMTPSAKEFISPLTLSTLSGNPVYSDFFDTAVGSWNSHVDMGLWADAFVFAPVTAASLAKMVMGLADNLVITTFLSARCPVLIAPAMDLDMYAHPSTQANLTTLAARGAQIIEPGVGELASGLEGKGRMAEPEQIAEVIRQLFEKNKPLKGKKVLITAGPTYEMIDPVRFIGNFSTGKMGYALAEEAAIMGANVLLISGPVALNPIHPSIVRININSAQQMYEHCIHEFESADIGIMCAAVADYTPEFVSVQKIKKADSDLTIKLKPTPDIAAALGQRKKNEQLLVGFALESENELENAKSKLKRKNFDFIVLNSLAEKGAGIGGNTNKITLIDKSMNVFSYPLKTKQEVAQDIIHKICEHVPA